MTKDHLRDYLQGMISPLLERPEEANVELSSDDMGALYTISVADADFGKLIGKGGQNISAVRSIITAVGMKHKIRAAVKVNDPVGA